MAQPSLSLSTPDSTDDRQIFSLSQVTDSIQRTLAARYTSGFWVKAEMNKLGRYKYSGHCYPELLEKTDGRIAAQMRCTLWSRDFERINQRFVATLGEGLRDGITILFFARVRFDAQYGISLHIEDIDPSYTLGILEAQKAAAIRQLKEEGLFAANKQLALPLLPQRLAIISVESSKGMQDFETKLDNNPAGYAIHRMLFPSLLQGDAAVPALIRQLERIATVAHHFDSVAIIRGGGGDVGLTCYNDYALCRAIATFPIPVLTGIGHAANETVAEQVACHAFITPTDLANFLLRRFDEAAAPVLDAEAALQTLAQEVCDEAQTMLEDAAAQLQFAARARARSATYDLSNLAHSLRATASTSVAGAQLDIHESSLRIAAGSRALLLAAREHISPRAVRTLEKDAAHILKAARQRIAHLESVAELMHPRNVLRRGYSITRIRGIVVKEADLLPPGAILETELHSGSVLSTVTDTRPPTQP